jgi:outer membrane autotransporter protein
METAAAVEDVGFYADMAGGYAYLSNGLTASVNNVDAGTTPGLNAGMFSATGGYQFEFARHEVWAISPILRYVGLSGNDTTFTLNNSTTAQITRWTSIGLLGLAGSYGGFSDFQFGGNAGIGLANFSGEAQTVLVEGGESTTFNWVNYSSYGLAYNFGLSAGYDYSDQFFLFTAVDYIGADTNTSGTSNTVLLESVTYNFQPQNAILLGLGVRIRY